jgi:hypothetical protein
LAEYLLANTAAMRIEASTHSDNLAEQRALEKLASPAKAGCGQPSSRAAPGATSCVMFSLVRCDLRSV